MCTLSEELQRGKSAIGQKCLKNERLYRGENANFAGQYRIKLSYYVNMNLFDFPLVPSEKFFIIFITIRS